MLNLPILHSIVRFSKTSNSTNFIPTLVKFLHVRQLGMKNNEKQNLNLQSILSKIDQDIFSKKAKGPDRFKG